MAMIKCKECSSDISDMASSCPKCGAPIVKTGKLKIFDEAIAAKVAKGYRVESRDDASCRAVIVIPQEKPNHILHLLLSVFTMGLWLIIWFFSIVGARGERRFAIEVNDAGQITEPWL